MEGRAAFARGLERAFAAVPGGVRIENTLSHAAALTADVIVSHGPTLKGAGRDGSGSPTRGS